MDLENLENEQNTQKDPTNNFDEAFQRSQAMFAGGDVSPAVATAIPSAEGGRGKVANKRGAGHRRSIENWRNGGNRGGDD